MASGVPRTILMTADAVGGVWTYALDLSRALGELGVSVHLAVMGPSPNGGQRQDAAGAGVTLHEGPFRLEWMDDPWPDVDRAAAWLLDLERRVAADVVHLNGYCHASLPWRAPAIVVAHSCVCSWWRAVHGEEAPLRYAEYRARVSAGARSARVIIAPSMAMLDAFAEEYGSLPRGRVIANGRAFDAAAGQPREPIVFSGGRLWDDAKNIQTLCAAAPSVTWPVFVAGDTQGPHGRPGAIESVRALGVLPPAAIREWYARAAIYALPARYEPFGLSIVEAARSGCALVLGDIRSLRENWDGAAMFVPPRDRHALAAAIQHLIDYEMERRRLSALAMARAARFTVERMAGAYLRLYTEVAAPVAAAVA